MKRFFQNMQWHFRQWMQGRYGPDELFRFLNIGALILFLLSFFWEWCYFPATAGMIFAYLRCFSRKFDVRRKELDFYFRCKRKVTTKISLLKRMWKDRKTHRYFKCKDCGTILRVPKGKGKIEFTCRNCYRKEIKKT